MHGELLDTSPEGSLERALEVPQGEVAWGGRCQNGLLQRVELGKFCGAVCWAWRCRCLPTQALKFTPAR